MAGSTIDHMVALTVFLGALLLFITLFNQTIQTAVLYQQHKVIASKCTDMLDNMMLNPGYPKNWSWIGPTPTNFGLQDPEFTQYKLSPFSLMRLRSLTGQTINNTRNNMSYSNISMGFGNFLLVPYTQVINYSTATALLGINGSYGFQLTIAPTITVSISESKSSNPLILAINVAGKGFPLSIANLSYCFLTVNLHSEPYPSYTTSYGPAYTDLEGNAILPFPEITDDNTPYALIVYAHLGGLEGLGYHQRVTSTQQYAVPLIDDLSQKSVLIAHSYDIHPFADPEADLNYSATFVLVTEDFTLREMPIDNSTGVVGQAKPNGFMTIPTTNPGIFVVTYKKSATEGGIIMMPWGTSSMAFTVTFGEDMTGKEWVATDTRQVTVDNVAYQAKLALWSLKGYQVIG
jgi:hypothetical protein